MGYFLELGFGSKLFRDVLIYTNNVCFLSFALFLIINDCLIMRFPQISCTIRSGRPQLYQDTTQQEEYI